MTSTLYVGECRAVMAGLPESSVDAVVTDPPYELNFMAKSWDGRGVAVDPATWAEALRVLKPGGHLLAFGGTRTFHRLTCAIEDAGFEIRDCLMWLHGQGYPKSRNISKAIDKTAGATRKVVGTKLGRPGMAKDGSNQSFDSSVHTYGSGGILSSDITAPATDAAKQWDGWGTALKPAWEPIILARKPFPGNVSANVVAFGTGALNIAGGRIGTDGGTTRSHQSEFQNVGVEGSVHATRGYRTGHEVVPIDSGRWPANLILDEEAAVALDASVESTTSRQHLTRRGVTTGSGIGYGSGSQGHDVFAGHSDRGGASRFFYTAKASRKERGEGNNHPTVKPLALMEWLVRLVTPPGGVVLDPFVGSGSTAVAADRLGFNFIGIDQEDDYVTIAERRLKLDAGMFAKVEVIR